MSWPYPQGVTPSVAPDCTLPATAEHSSCPQCGSSRLRPNGHYRNAWNEVRQAVECKDCSRGFYLPLGQHLPRRITHAQQEQFAVAEDSRPACPFCGGHSVNRRGVIHLKAGGTTQRWRCQPCGKRFVSAGHRVATADHRKVSHWEEVDPRSEARFLFHFARRNGDIRGMRRLIDIGQKEKRDLEYLVSEGALTETEVADAIWFRGRVLEIFDGLVAEHQRCADFLASHGMTADRLAEPFAKLVDVETAVTLQSLGVQGEQHEQETEQQEKVHRHRHVVENLARD